MHRLNRVKQNNFFFFFDVEENLFPFLFLKNIKIPIKYINIYNIVYIFLIIIKINKNIQKIYQIKKLLKIKFNKK